ncbi:MAG: CHAT domain-containing protein [Trebonia sp.]
MNGVKSIDPVVLTEEKVNVPVVAAGPLREKRVWAERDFRRAANTVFISRWPYLLISFFRRWASDIIALIPLAAAGAWWITASSGTFVAGDSVSTPDSFQQFLLSHHVSRFYPTLVAFLLCVLILRTGRTQSPRRARGARVSLAGRTHPVLVFFLLALAVLDLILVPGPIAERAGPCVVAAAWGWLIRSQVYGRVRLLEPTDAGFRPPARIALRRKSRKFARSCLTSSWRYQESIGAERAAIEAAIRHFARRGKTRTLAWCVARGVDYNLRANALDAAEALLDRASKYPELELDPTVRAAHGLFERATRAAGTALADTARLCEDSHRRIPYRLRVLRAEPGMSPSAAEEQPPRWSERARASLVWGREYAAVLRDILATSRPLVREDPELATALAGRTEGLVDFLGTKSARADLTAQEADKLRLVKAAARERRGEMLTARQRFRESAALYASAAALYRQTRYRPRAGLAAARAALLALRAGVAEGAKAESDLLTALLTGLQDIEYDRGRLRDARFRSGLLAASQTLYSEVFEVLADCVTASREKTAELALWLLESVHRNHLAENIQASHESGTGGEAAEALRRLREPADVARIRQLFTGRAALYYRCDRTEAGWQVSTVLVAPSGVSLRRTLLPVAEPGAGLITAMRKPGALLDVLASRDPSWVSRAHTTIRLDQRVWAALAAALLPPELDGVLRSLESPEGPAVLVIVPDGPLSSVPFGGLRLADGSAVTDHAAVVFMPNLLPFAANAWTGATADGRDAIVAHFGPTMFRDAFESLRRDPMFPSAQLWAAPDLESFVAALWARPRIAVISHHGETAAKPADRYINFEGGGKLSAEDAKAVPWPQTVVLGSCWASDITVHAGDDPLGLPTACLLGGARAVLGGQSRVDNDQTSARILAQVTLEATVGRHPALALHDAIVRHLAAEPTHRVAPPAQWANMTVWTSQPPASPRPIAPSWDSWTTELTARPPGEDQYAAFDMALLAKAPADRSTRRGLSVKIGPALRRALEHAHGTTERSWVTSADLLVAIFATDSADWASFSVAADLPARPAAEPHKSHEENAEPAVITLDLDHQVRVSAVVSGALRWAERLATHLRDPAITPAHMVYGFLCDENGDACRWMVASSHDVPALRALLSDRVFGVDLPAPSDLPALSTKPRLSRPRQTRRDPPMTSREVLRMISADRSREVLTTLDFIGAVAAANSAAWQQLTRSGFRLSPPDTDPFLERGHGGTEIVLGDGYLATVSHAFDNAFRKARALAYHRGDPEVLPAHLLYGMLTDRASDAARWLQPEGVVAALAKDVFGDSLPAPHALPAAPKPQRPRPVRARKPVPLPLLILAMPFLWLLLKIMTLAEKTVKAVVSLVVISPFILLVLVTMGLADINTAVPNNEQLSTERSALTGMVSLAGPQHGAAIPATLVGRLSTFWSTPVIKGAENILRASLSKWVGTSGPGSISGWYLFALPTPPHPAATMSGWLEYRGARYRALVTCQGNIASLLCFGAVSLPGSVAPGGFSWGTENLTNGATGDMAPQQAFVYQGVEGRETIGLANLEIYAQASGGDDFLKVEDQAGEPIRAGSPVVLDDRSRVMPLFGIAVPEKNGGQWDLVYPFDLLSLYADGIADRMAGTPPPGTQAYAGIEYTGSPGPVTVEIATYGGPADDAGIRPGDQLLAIDRRAITSPTDVAHILSVLRPDQTVPVEVLRGGRTITLKVTLGYRPT